MIGGILIGIGVAALTFAIAWLLRKGRKPTIITYIVTIVAVVVLSIEGLVMLKAYNLKHNINQTMSLAQQTIMAYVPDQGLNYTITPNQATAVSLALNLAVPSISDYIGPDDMAGKTVVDTLETIRLTVEQGAAKQTRKTIWILVISSLLFILLNYVSYAIGESVSFGSGRGYSSGGGYGSGDSSYSSDYLNF